MGSPGLPGGIRPTALPMTPAAEPAFRLPIRIYWEDTDAGGVVFYANYLRFFERARTEWLRAKGCSQERLRLEGTGFVVTDTSVRYLLPARLDDLLRVSVETRRIGAASLALRQRAWRESGGRDELLADGTIRVGCVDLGTFKPCRIPNEILDSLR